MHLPAFHNRDFEVFQAHRLFVAERNVSTELFSVQRRLGHFSHAADFDDVVADFFNDYLNFLFGYFFGGRSLRKRY